MIMIDRYVTIHGKYRDYVIKADDINKLLPDWIWDAINPTVWMEGDSDQDHVDYLVKLYNTCGGYCDEDKAAIDYLLKPYLLFGTICGGMAQ